MTQTLAQVGGFFANGAALAMAGAAAIAIPVVIHLLTRLQRRPQAWGAMRFVIEAFRRHRTRLRLEQWLLLLVRCLIPLLLGLALAGPLIAGLGDGVGTDASGRVVCIIIDDSLSTRALESDDADSARFEKLRAAAVKLIDELKPSDRVALWRAATPAKAMFAPPTLDHAAVKRDLKTLEPRFARGDINGALTLASAMLKQVDTPRDRAFVVVLSDLAPDTLPIDKAGDPTLTRLQRQAHLLVTKPAATRSNVQVTAVASRRRMVTPSAATGALSVPVRVALRRFQSDDERTSKVDLELVARGPGRKTPGQVIGKHSGTMTWQKGQNNGSLNMEVSVDPQALADLASRRGGPNVGSAGGGRTVSVVARLAEDDALPADNLRIATVELRHRLTVGIVDDIDAPATGDTAIPSRRWMSFALSPRAALEARQPGGVEVAEASAALLDGKAMAGWDAAVILRPDLLTDDGWAALRTLAEEGGLVVFTAPPDTAAAQWPGLLPTKFNLDWTIAGEPRVLDENDPLKVWSLKTDGDPPTELALLAPDFEALRVPIRVNRRFDVTFRTPDAGQAWLAVRDGNESKPLLAYGRVGQGGVLLLATAIDLDWTNLPTKPLFVPLLHESLRGVLGGARSSGVDDRLICGRQPALGPRWAGVQQLVHEPIGDDTKVKRSKRDAKQVLLRLTDAGLEPATPLPAPGLWVAAPQSNGRVLAVNVDDFDGDTRTLNENSVAEWLDATVSADNWRWLDTEQPGQSLASHVASANVGWPLLWAVLVLLLLELCLARWFSHAHAGARASAGPAVSGAAGFVQQAAQRAAESKS